MSDYVFVPPPNWPATPEGWTPPAGWQPDPAWGPAPEGWQFWRLVQAPEPAPAPWAMPPTAPPPPAADVPPAVQPPAVQPPAMQPPAVQPPAMQPPLGQPPHAQPPHAQPPLTQPLPSAPARPFTMLPAAAPSSGGSWFSRHKVLSGVGGAFLAMVLVSAVSGGGGDDSSGDVSLAAAAGSGSDATAGKTTADKAAAEKAAADKAAADKAAADKAAKAAADKAKAAKAKAKGPADQQALLAAVVRGREAFRATDNELKQRQIQKQRDQEACAAVPGLKVSNWVGKIKSLDTNGEGKAVLELSIGADTKVATWNNAFSDTFDNTLIPMDSDMYTTLVDLEKGDSVRFSGTFLDDQETCLGEHSLTLYGQMNTPNFVFRFSEVSPA